jgi:hypothetical protein
VPRRSRPAPLPDGVARVRLSGDTIAADVLVAILRAHAAIEILSGPDAYDDGRQYLMVRVRMDGGLGRQPGADSTTLAPLPGPRLLPAPCGDYDPADPDGPCTTCGRSAAAHRMAAEAASAPWTGDNDGSTS